MSLRMPWSKRKVATHSRNFAGCNPAQGEGRETSQKDKIGKKGSESRRQCEKEERTKRRKRRIKQRERSEERETKERAERKGEEEGAGAGERWGEKSGLAE
eukprot:6203612-Pleurochrysis_carterae.AAC.3